MESLNIDNEIIKENNIKNEKENLNSEKNKNQSKTILINKLPLNKIKEKINSNEIYIEYAPPSSPKRRKMENPRIKFSNSIKIGQLYGIEKHPSSSLFNEESKSDDEDNINEQKISIVLEEETESRKSIYTRYNSDLEKEIKKQSNIDEIFDGNKYIKKLEEKWKYEKILLDYNIIDFTSK